MPKDPKITTPLGSNIISPKEKGKSISENSIYQLQIIRGFVSFISGEIQALFAPANINVSINKISQINAYYQQQAISTGRNRPLYLIYLDLALRYIISEIKKGTIRLSLPCRIDDCGEVTSAELGINDGDFAELDAAITPLLGMLNGGIVLTKAAKLKLYSDIRLAKLNADARIASKNKINLTTDSISKAKKPKTGGSTKKHKKRKTKRKQRNRRRTNKRRSKK